MSVILGVAGATRNAAVALCDGGRLVAVCERERVTRTRRAGLRTGRLPLETLDTVLQLGGCGKDDVSAYVVGEANIQLPPGLPVERLDHHHAHAATSFLTSPFDEATVLICDRRGLPELTVWRGDQSGLRRENLQWVGPAFASVYSQATEALGFAPDGDEHRLEALAHVARQCPDASGPMVAYRGNHLEVSPHFKASIANLVASNGHDGALAQRASIAERIQRHIGHLLVELVRDLKTSYGGRHLCLGGGLFYNSYFTTLLAASGLYEETFVPVNPGNPGIAVGAALEVARTEGQFTKNGLLSPFLGPSYSTQDIKGALDNCKLSYDYLRNGQVIERTAAALVKGQLVGWFQGRMEWGPKALGNRSILASPVAPYLLENLNVFLKQREPHRSYSVSICAEDLSQYFRGPAASDFMEYEYEVIDPDLLRPLLPLNASRIRVQTVPESAEMFHELIKAFGNLTGVPILVNTSFNGFNEPMVCTPRDAVRVFYGTGLDMAVIGSFVLRK